MEKQKRGRLAKIKIFIYITYTSMKHPELNKTNELHFCLLFLHYGIKQKQGLFLNEKFYNMGKLQHENSQEISILNSPVYL